MRVEYAVTGAGARDDGDGGAGGDEEGERVDVEDADQIGAEIRDHEVFVRRIETYLMWVRKGLLRLETRWASEVECLKRREEGRRRVKRPRGECMSVVRDG